MELLLVRHGQPDWTPDRIARNDPDLTPLGYEQAKRVAQRLGELDRVDQLWVSPMNRARQTSVPVATELETVARVCEWLQEINNPPEWDGSPADEID
jgi:probable phosphoglycerate mutase